jgi:P-type E1-E2 ATPase
LTIQRADAPSLELAHLLLDLNGTISAYGELIDGVADRLATLRHQVSVCIMSADTFGTAQGIADSLDVNYQYVKTGSDKLAAVSERGAANCGAVGNGTNDAAMLQAAALGIAIIGQEGCSVMAIESASIVCHSITDALDLFLKPTAINATLRA